MPLSWALRLPVKGRIAVRLPGGIAFEYRSSPRDWIGRKLCWSGWLWGHEPSTAPLYFALARRAQRIVDIGANTGFYTLLACAANPDCRVIAFEPFPNTRKLLEANVQANGWQDRCTIRGDAVSEAEGCAQFYVPFDEEVPVSASLISGHADKKGYPIDVPVTTLDAACSEVGDPDLVKIDAEGVEDKVLHGMKEIFSRSRPAVFLECHPGRPAETMQELFSRMDYRIFRLTAEEPIAIEGIDSEADFRNFLCLPESRMAEFPDLLKIGGFGDEKMQRE